MASRDDRVYRHCFIKLLKKDRYVPWLLIGLSVAFPCSIVLQEPTLAQAEIAQSLTLDKNIIYVNPQQGDDSQAGDKSSPLKTITQALEIAPSGSKIQLASGTYSEETGETFPLIIKNKITLQGDRRSQGQRIIIQGGGNFTSPTGAGQNVALAALKDAGGITGVTVTNESSRGHGLWIESSSPNVIGNTFTRNGNTGVSVNGNSSPLIEDNYFYNNAGNGLLVYGTSQPEVIDNIFEQTGFGVSLVQDAALMLTGNLFDGNRIGIILEGNSQGILRDNEIINSTESGLTAISQSRVDLGTSNESGNNVFRSNKLDIQNATNNQIVAVGTETQEKIEGDINFDSGEFVATDSTSKDLPPLQSQSNLDDRPIAIERDIDSDRAESIAIDSPFKDLPPLPSQNNLDNPPVPPTSSQTATSLPSPPPASENNNSNKELVFTAPSNSSTAPEPVPFPPQTSSPALSSLARVKYKVLVEALNEAEEDEVRSLYPQAFETVFDGQSWLQVGAFSNKDKARQAEQTLVDLGLETYLLE